MRFNIKTKSFNGRHMSASEMLKTFEPVLDKKDLDFNSMSFYSDSGRSWDDVKRECVQLNRRKTDV